MLLTKKQVFQKIFLITIIAYNINQENRKNINIAKVKSMSMYCQLYLLSYIKYMLSNTSKSSMASMN